MTGSDATAVVDSIERASHTELRIPCPAIASTQDKELAIIAVTTDGSTLPTVTTNVSIPDCDQPITNGTAVRWAWTPPAAVAARISRLTPFLPVTIGSGMNGSPVR